MIEVKPDTALTIAQKVKAGELPGPAKSLAEAMNRVMEAVAYVHRDKQMKGGGSYRYVSVEAVITALRPEMIRQGLVLVPTDSRLVHHEVVNGKMNRVMLSMEFRLTHVASAEFIGVSTIGEAMDIGDKASNKAMTAARKYALILAFNIETGDDPDDTPSSQQERAPAAAPSRRDELFGIARNAPSRAALESVYRTTQADAKDGRLTAAEADEVFAVITAAAKRFPKPAPTEPAKK